MDIIYAIVLGTLFGFVLHKVGASNPRRIVDMLRLTDLHLMKAILLGIGLSSLVLFTLVAVGLVDVGQFHVKSAYSGVILGGALLGIGWALSGYCPGTGVVAAGSGRKDALLFVLGGLVGALLYALIYGGISSSALFAKIAGGKTTLALTGNSHYAALIGGVPGLVVAGVIALGFCAIAWVLPLRRGR
jgi:uncharacterized membrane protein YedE/YeeE